MVSWINRGADLAAPIFMPILDNSTGFQLVVGGVLGVAAGVGLGAGVVQATSMIALGALFKSTLHYLEEYGDDSSRYFSERTINIFHGISKVATVVLPLFITLYLAPPLLGFAATNLPLLAGVLAPKAAATYTLTKGAIIAGLSIAAYQLLREPPSP